MSRLEPVRAGYRTLRAEMNFNINIQKCLRDLSQLEPVRAKINFNLLLSQIEFYFVVEPK